MERDYTKALLWYTKAYNESGVTKALLKIGKFYYDGQCVEISHKKALLWFERSLSIDETPEAQNYIGVIYMKGESEVQ